MVKERSCDAQSLKAKDAGNGDGTASPPRDLCCSHFCQATCVHPFNILQDCIEEKGSGASCAFSSSLIRPSSEFQTSIILHPTLLYSSST